MKLLIAGLAAAAILLGAPGASAKPSHCPPGHAKKGWCGARGGIEYDGQYHQRRPRVDYYERRARGHYGAPWPPPPGMTAGEYAARYGRPYGF